MGPRQKSDPCTGPRGEDAAFGREASCEPLGSACYQALNRWRIGETEYLENNLKTQITKKQIKKINKWIKQNNQKKNLKTTQNTEV